ncbi:hypothetical protein ACNGYR_002120 [Serratia marcescens]
MSNPFNPLDWIQSTQDWFRKTEVSSGFRPYLIIVVMTLGLGFTMLILFRDDYLIKRVSLGLIVGPIMVISIVYFIKAFTNPDFCRSEKHVQVMRKIEIESFGTEQKQIPSGSFIDMDSDEDVNDMAIIESKDNS